MISNDAEDKAWSDYKIRHAEPIKTEPDELKDITKDALRALSHVIGQYNGKDAFMEALSADFAQLMIRFNKFK